MSVTAADSPANTREHSPLPYVLPFGVLMVLLGTGAYIPVPAAWGYPLRTLAVLATVLAVSIPVLDLRVQNVTGSVLLGLAMFVVWIAPEALVPGWREHWLFANAVVGRADGGGSAAHALNPVFIVFRVAGSVLLVPVVEELFWRAFLMRWLITPRFWKIRLGTYTPMAFWATAALFGVEHGPHWEVGLAAGIAYGWWMVRTRSLGDCILAHAVTNGALAAYVVTAGKWAYWL